MAWSLQASRKNGDKLPKNCREPKFLQYRDVCRFGHQLKRVREYFPEDQLKVVLFEKWTQDPRRTYAEVMQFLGIPDNGYSDFKKINTKRKNRSRWLGQLVRRPPASLLSLAAFAKKILGLERLRIASKIRQMNERDKPIHAQISNSLRQQIRHELSTDRRLLESTLGYSIDAWPRADQQDHNLNEQDSDRRVE